MLHLITISKRDYVLHKNCLDQSVSNYTIVFTIIEIYYKKIEGLVFYFGKV